MKLKKTRQFIIIFTCIAIMLGISIFVHVKKTHDQVSPVLPPLEKVAPTTEGMSTIKMTVDNISYSLPTNGTDTLYKLLTNAKHNNILTFSAKEYPTLGFFITSIGTLHEGNGKYIIYYVNGKEATEGISTFIPHVNDVIVWKLQ